MWEVTTIAAAVAVGATLLTMVVTAVWTVAAVRSTTAVLTSELSHLSNSIERLNAKLDGHEEGIRSLEHRVTILEQRSS